MISFLFRGVLGVTACAVLSGSALAHVTLERPTAIPNTTYRGVLQVNHGCKGATTTAISVTIPDGVIGVRPMPKPGWSLDIRKAAFKKPYKLYGETLTEGAQTLTWSGGSIPDDQYDEFVFVARVSDDYAPGATIYFPVVQTCGTAQSRWVEVPKPGDAGARLPEPAPAVRIVARAGDAAPAMPEHDMSMHMAAAGGPPAAAGGTYKVGSLTVEQPWMRATPGGAKVAGGYVRITNTGNAPDRLVSASIPIAARGEVHQMSTEGGIMKMNEVEGGLEIKPGESVELKPGGYHIMFMELSAAPKQGETVQGTLTFEKAGAVQVAFPVAPIGAPGPAKN